MASGHTTLRAQLAALQMYVAHWRARAAGGDAASEAMVATACPGCPLDGLRPSCFLNCTYVVFLVFLWFPTRGWQAGAPQAWLPMGEFEKRAACNLAAFVETGAVCIFTAASPCRDRATCCDWFPFRFGRHQESHSELKAITCAKYFGVRFQLLQPCEGRLAHGYCAGLPMGRHSLGSAGFCTIRTDFQWQFSFSS
jgi:hypothetical protein